jgi:DNA-binding transcriptional LysR family regulator
MKSGNGAAGSAAEGTPAESRRDRGKLQVSLQALQVFCEVVRLQSFSRGATASGISQSAASQLIRHLEDELRVELIDRKQRPLRPTPEGEIYYRGCQELLHGHRLVVDEMRRVSAEVSGLVRVASIYSVGLHTLNRHIQKFMAAEPGSTVRLEYLLPNKVYTAVLNDEADIGVTSYPRPTRGLTVIPWFEEEMALASNPEHRLARKRRLRPADLEGEKFVAFDRDLPIRREVDRALKQNDVTVQVISEFDNIETIKQALEISDAVSVLPRASIDLEVRRGSLKAVPIEGIELRRPVGIIHKKRKNLTPTALLFIEFLTGARG